MPKSQRTASFLYLRSPRELILIAGSFPRLPHLLIVRGETLKTWATSFTVSKSGSSSKLSLLLSFIIYKLLGSILRQLLLSQAGLLSYQTDPHYQR